MKVTGNLVGANFDLDGNMQVTIRINEKAEMAQFINDHTKEEKLSVELKKHRDKRSLDANGMLWACIGQIADALRSDKWQVYLNMLKRYGRFTYIMVLENAVPGVKEVWRECDEVGECIVDGRKMVQMLCYYGSSTYDTQEFSILLDGVISEMQEMGLHLPLPEEVEKSLNLWERRTNGKADT